MFIVCPICKHKFEENYYNRWHVPCPETAPLDEGKDHEDTWDD